MARTKTGLFDNKAYQNEYHKAMKTKLISFNPANPDDMELWDHLQTKENQTKYIKDLMRDDIRIVRCKDCIIEDCTWRQNPDWFCADGKREEEVEQPEA